MTSLYSDIAEAHQRKTDCFRPCGLGLMAHSHRRLRVGSVCIAHCRVSTANSGRDPDWAVLVSQYSSVGVLRAWKGPGKFELHTLSIDWSTESSLPCDRGIITNKHSTPWGISGQLRKLCLWKKQKFAVLLGRPTLLLFVRCARSSFSLDLLAGYTASTVWLTPRPTIRVLVALETGAVTEPGFTAPSLLGWSVLGPKCTRQWKCAFSEMFLGG